MTKKHALGITPLQVTRIVPVSRQAVYQWINSDPPQLEHIRVGKRILVTAYALKKSLKVRMKVQELVSGFDGDFDAFLDNGISAVLKKRRNNKRKD